MIRAGNTTGVQVHQRFGDKEKQSNLGER